MTSNVPEIRFDGYEGEWDEVKLGEISKSYSGGTPNVSNKEYYFGEIPFIRSGEISRSKTKLFINQLALEESSAKMVSEGDILYALYGATSGEVSISKINGAINQAILAIIPNSSNDAKFLSEFLKKEKTNIVNTYIQGGQGNLSGGIIKTVKIKAPQISEQQAIGTFFKELDDRIGLQQTSLESLKETKQGFLQKMFPKKGETTPEIRFEGFEGEWLMKKMSDLLVERNDQEPASEEFPLMSFVKYIGVTPKGERYDRGFLVKSSSKLYKRTQKGDFIYSSNNLDTGSIGFNKTGNATISPVYSIFSSIGELESEFIGIISQRKEFISEMIRYRQGVMYGQWRIHEKDFLNMDIYVPENKEQFRIIKFFKELDDAIDLEERELELLKETKKAFLKKMFV